MYPLYDELIEEQRRKDRMTSAEQMRIQALISRKPTPGGRFFAVLMAGLGNWLVVVGCRLQERYEAVKPSQLAVYPSSEELTSNCTS